MQVLFFKFLLIFILILFLILSELSPILPDLCMKKGKRNNFFCPLYSYKGCFHFHFTPYSINLEKMQSQKEYLLSMQTILDDFAWSNYNTALHINNRSFLHSLHALTAALNLIYIPYQMIFMFIW